MVTQRRLWQGQIILLAVRLWRMRGEMRLIRRSGGASRKASFDCNLFKVSTNYSVVVVEFNIVIGVFLHHLGLVINLIINCLF